MSASPTLVFPFYVKACIILLLIILLGGIIVIGKDIIIPFAFSLLIAVLLLPFNKFLENYKVNRVIAILITLVISLFLFAVILYFLASQIVDFSKDIPAIKKQLMHHVVVGCNPGDYYWGMKLPVKKQ